MKPPRITFATDIVQNFKVNEKFLSLNNKCFMFAKAFNFYVSLNLKPSFSISYSLSFFILILSYSDK
jgi:hypothetical protein